MVIRTRFISFKLTMYNKFFICNFSFTWEWSVLKTQRSISWMLLWYSQTWHKDQRFYSVFAVNNTFFVCSKGRLDIIKKIFYPSGDTYSISSQVYCVWTTTTIGSVFVSLWIFNFHPFEPYLLFWDVITNY